MQSYRIGFDDDTFEIVSAVSFTQAFRSAASLRSGEGFTIRPATDEEVAEWRASRETTIN